VSGTCFWVEFTMASLSVLLCADLVASLARVELATYRLGGGCSILLSYRDMSEIVPEF
jgi:hypothetical protein